MAAAESDSDEEVLLVPATPRSPSASEPAEIVLPAGSAGNVVRMCAYVVDRGVCVRTSTCVCELACMGFAHTHTGLRPCMQENTPRARVHTHKYARTRTLTGLRPEWQLNTLERYHGGTGRGKLVGLLFITRAG